MLRRGGHGRGVFVRGRSERGPARQEGRRDRFLPIRRIHSLPGVPTRGSCGIRAARDPPGRKWRELAYRQSEFVASDRITWWPQPKRRHDCRRGTHGAVRHKGILSAILCTILWFIPARRREILHRPAAVSAVPAVSAACVFAASVASAARVAAPVVALLLELPSVWSTVDLLCPASSEASDAPGSAARLLCSADFGISGPSLRS